MFGLRTLGIGDGCVFLIWRKVRFWLKGLKVEFEVEILVSCVLKKIVNSIVIEIKYYLFFFFFCQR